MARKKRAEGTRAPNGASTIYEGKDGYWHGRVTVGVLDNGKPDRRHVQGKDESAVIDKVRELERERDDGTVRKVGQAWTVEQWLRHWIENISAPSVRPNTLAGNRTAVYRHLIPNLGGQRINKIEPEHFEKLYQKMQKSGLKPATAHHVHRTARTAFREAYRRRYVSRNPMEFVKAPRIVEEEVEPFGTDEIQQLIKAALVRRNGVRFVIALALGGRQGEVLGLKWVRLNEETKVLRVKKSLQRHPWQHGCDDPHKCGERSHRMTKCKQPCKRHTRPCPEPCAADCTKHATMCPKRHGGGLVEVDVKSAAGRRSFAVPDQLFELLLKHKELQEWEREQAGTEWQEGGWMFTQPNGKPIDARRDHDDWKELLTAAGVRDARLHDARHTAATVLLILGVPNRTVMDVMGWSTESMKKRYMHVTEGLRRDVADQLNAYFWKVNRDDK